MENHQELINNCYKNDFGINLREYHKHICKPSNNEKILIEAINDSGRVIFEDGNSSSFKLVIVGNLVYLLGDKSCFLCSNVVESAYGHDLNWVKCVVIPGQVKIKGETDIRKSGVIVSMFSDLVPQIPDVARFNDFVKKLEFTFSDCDWFKRIHSLSLYIRLVPFWDYKAKIKQLFEMGLLYPLEFVIFAIYRKIEIKNDRILKYFVASLAESTNKIFRIEEINDFFQSLTTEEIEDILALNHVKHNVNLHLLNDDYFADLLELDGTERYGMFMNDMFYLYYMRQRASSIFKFDNYKKSYLKILNGNFRALENRMRKGKGFDQVGSFYMEKLLHNRLQNEFPQATIITQYSPVWLCPQRLDVFIAECSIAVEYHGAQHFLPIDFFGGSEGLKLRQELDLLKREKCEANGLRLFEISFEEDFEFAFVNLKKTINDALCV